MHTRFAIIVTVLLSAVTASAQSAAQPAPGSDTLVIAAGGWVDPNGVLQPGRAIVIERGTIQRLGDEAPPGVRVDAYPGAVVCPGLVDCLAQLGCDGGLSERAQSVQPKLDARDALNRYSSQLRAALAAGVTTFALAPDDQNLIGGRIAVCCFGPDGKPFVLSEPGPWKLSLAPAVLKQDREPTSRGGAVGLLRDTLAAARKAGPADPLATLVQGQTSAILTAPSGADVLSGVELAEQFGLQLALVHTDDARKVAEALAGHARGVIVGPLDLSTSPRAAAAAALLEKHGVPVALAGGLPARPADSLRLAATVAARAGLSKDAARRAMTSVPANLLNVADRTGSLQVGRVADLVVFSGDPLDLRSRVLAVYVAGQRVSGGAPAAAPGEVP